MKSDKKFVITYKADNGDFVKVHLPESEVASDIGDMLHMGGFELVSVEPEEEN